MYIGEIEFWKEVQGISPRLQLLFDFLQDKNLAELPTGRIELSGDDVFINSVETTLKRREEQPLEAHRQYLDVHIPISQPETIGFSYVSSLPSVSFDEANDCALYSSLAATYITVKPGEFCICFPNDAHAPLIGEGFQKKLIAKIKID